MKYFVHSIQKFFAHTRLLIEEFYNKLYDFISVFDEVIDKLSDDSRPTLHRVIPLRQHLINLCSISDNDNDNDNLIHLKKFIDISRLRSINYSNDTFSPLKRYL